jgi:hypothetical protein
VKEICKGRGEEGEDISNHWMLKLNNILNIMGCSLLKKRYWMTFKKREGIGIRKRKH